MTENCKKIYDRCQSITEEFELSAITTVLNEYIPLFNEEKAIFTFVDLSGLPDGLMMVAKKICDEDILKDYIEQINQIKLWNDWCVRLEYGEKAAYFDVRTLIITAPIDILSDKTVILLNAGTIENACTRDVAASAKVFLLTSAVMAMTRTQKEWISGFLQKHFDLKRFSVCIFGTDKLVEEEQEIQVLNYVRDYLDKFSTKSAILTEDEILKEMVHSDMESLIFESEKQLSKNMIHEIESILNYELEGCNGKKEDYIHIADEIENYRSWLLKAGEISAKNVLGNQIKAIIDAVSNSSEEYSNAMFENIKQTILSAKDVEDVESRICSYMEYSWNYFAEQTSRQIVKDFDIIYVKLTQRMEDDMEDMMKRLDIRTQAMLARFVNNNDIVFVAHVELEPANDEALKAVCRNARNMVILSIPLLFISPTLSAAVLLSGGIYSSLGKKKEGEKYREELVKHVERACIKAKKIAVNSFVDTLEGEYERMEQFIIQGYKNFLEMILEELENRKAAVEVSSERAVQIKKIQKELSNQRISL